MGALWEASFTRRCRESPWAVEQALVPSYSLSVLCSNASFLIPFTQWEEMHSGKPTVLEVKTCTHGSLRSSSWFQHVHDAHSELH